MSLLIKHGTVINADARQRADVLITDGMIVAVRQDLDAPTGAEVIDAGGQYVMPGGIDPHTHMQLPFMGTVASEDFLHWHRCGACGRHHHDHRFCHPGPAATLNGSLSHLARLGGKSLCRL